MYGTDWNKLAHDKKIERVKRELERDIARWYEIAENGCSDPFWPDGVNLNLKRNHIINDLRILDELEQKPMQMTLDMLFNPNRSVENDRRVPQKVPDDYMVKDRPCGYFRRRDNDQ